MGTNHQLHHHHLVKKLIPYALYIIIPLAIIHLVLFPIPLSLLNFKVSTPNTTTILPPPPPPRPEEAPFDQGSRHRRCNYFDGNWVPSSSGPLYNGSSCTTIKDGQNCMAHGRPDTGYLHWRWQPKQCQLPPFDAVEFLNLIHNKHVAFVGDSLARNQLESLLCLLATAEKPELVFTKGDDNKFRRWVFPGRNATVSVLWSPFLVKGVEKSQDIGLNYNKLYLDQVNDRWAKELPLFDVVVFSIGHWFLHPAVYYENGAVIGCHEVKEINCTEVEFVDVFRKALRTTLNEMVRQGLSSSSSSSSKLAVVTTFTPSHFEGEWDKFGACSKMEPYKDGEKEMDQYTDALMRKFEVEEVAVADEVVIEQGGGRRLRIEALDVTKLAFMRPDGHPGPYMYANPFAEGVKDRVQNDCVHWCLPGPIDTWNEILLQIMR